MCGLCVVITFETGDGETSSCDESAIPPTSLTSVSFENLQNRGPDAFHSLSIRPFARVKIDFYGFLLHFRGDFLVAQPFEDRDGNLLLWNGEIFGGDLYSTDNMSDTISLSKAFCWDGSEPNILSVVRNIRGPWSFVYFQKKDGRLWFGRDALGRRSLLWNLSTTSSKSSFILSSVMTGPGEWKEVGCEGIFCIDFWSSIPDRSFNIRKYLWSTTPSGLPIQSLSFSKENSLIKTVVADNQLRPPVSNPLSKEFSDDTIETGAHSTKLNEKLFERLASSAQYKGVLAQFEIFLSNAVKLRVENVQSACKHCIGKQIICVHSFICILFSGGLDSIVIASLVDRHIRKNVPIDLINVAFSMYGDDSPIEPSFDTPDRITARQGLEELKRLSPNRKWNLVEVNVTQAELRQERRNSISQLIHPSSTVLDDSIGCALWFAARGSGVVLGANGEVTTYQSPARVAFLGMGADELLGGYSRHRAKFSTGGWSALHDEMSIEIDRIGSRNLGRDDRIISDHGREARFPFLDENVVNFLNKTPLHLKVNLHYSRGVGEKLLLRLMAFRLGLRGSAVLPKRAIQFGSRIARCENRKERGSDVCDRMGNESTA